MTTTQTRAKVGGEVGANGEFYEGGKFLNTVADKGKGKPAKAKARKVQIECGVWVVSDRTPIFQMVGAQAGYIDRYAPAEGICPSAAGVAYYGDTFGGVPVSELCDRFNAGERWL